MTTKQVKEVCWALFDENWRYKGGIILAEGKMPTEVENPEGWQARQVYRFPQYHEQWDQQKQAWKSDNEVKRRAEIRANAQSKTPDAVTQAWMYALLKRLFPNIQVPEDVMDEYFPSVKGGRL